jgi:hypothetical protein
MAPPSRHRRVVLQFDQPVGGDFTTVVALGADGSHHESGDPEVVVTQTVDELNRGRSTRCPACSRAGTTPPTTSPRATDRIRTISIARG